MFAEDVVLTCIDEHLEGAVVVAAEAGVFLASMGERPDIRREGLVKILAFENQRIHEDLEFVVGDELVAEGGGIEGERQKDQDGEMQEADAIWRRGRGIRAGCGVGRGKIRGVLMFSGQGYGSLTQG